MIEKCQELKSIRSVRFWLTDLGALLSLGCLMVVASYVFWVNRFAPDASTRALVVDLLQPAIAFAMFILALRAARQKELDQRSRRAWIILSVAFACYFLGNVIWAGYEIGLGESPAVSWADLPYLLYYPTALAGLFNFPFLEGRKSRPTFVLDAGTVMVGAATLLGYLVLWPIIQSKHSSSLEMFVTLAYPVSNAVLLFGAIALLLRSPAQIVRVPLVIFVFAIFSDTIADCGYAYETLLRSYVGGDWPDYLYLTGFSLMALSAHMQTCLVKQGPVTEPVTTGRISPFCWIPYSAVALVHGLLATVAIKHHFFHADEPIFLLVAGAVIVTGLVLIRQFIALSENSRLLREKAARETEERFASLVQHSRDTISIIKPEGKLLYLSPSVASIFGYQPDELIGTNLMERIHPEDKQQAAAIIETVRTTAGKSAFVEARAIHRDGHWLDIEAVVTNMLDDPRVGGVVINSRDISERKKTQAALQQREEQLRQAMKMEAVGQLAGGVAHDFNNLLAVILGYSDMLSDNSRTLNDRQLRHLEQIKKAAERAASLTRQLLAFSRKQMMKPKILDLNVVITDIGKMLKRLIGEHIELTTSLDLALAQVKADSGQIEQVLLNLAVNARDAMPHGGKLRIETANVYFDRSLAQKHPSTEPGYYVRIAVSDTGAGMDHQTQSRIFEPFFTTKEQGRGTGLGLSTVYGIVKQSGGSIWVYSEVGIGTTFKVYLPRATGIECSVATELPALPPTPGEGTILLVEDERSVREMAHELLRESGYNVLKAKDGTEALQLADEHKGKIDLMVTDVIMPKMSGRQLADKLSTSRPNMRVMYMSGYTDDAIVHHGVLDEGTCFLEKPFSPHAFKQRIHEVLNGTA